MKNRTLLLTSSLVLLMTLTVSGCAPLIQQAQQVQQELSSAIEQVDQAVPQDLQAIISSQSATITDGIAKTLTNTTIELTATNPKAGETALDLLKNSGAKVELKSYGSMGSFITSINMVEGDANNYWAFYVNDKYAEQAADKTILKPGDRVKFVFEKVSTAPVQ